ncbi:hypothetical protein OIE66_34650 [Nonomuraea sp. NBC_01738]|uniref:trypsin-like serine peptidase n=1 Tax=Nonomuraea sp. NBC_01738 TaxID=2976003 RepID=UPI002E14E70C|nr:hypothetical protein OIE66_34650 [Nonomuraea sp. NBC_01738]
MRRALTVLGVGMSVLGSTVVTAPARAEGVVAVRLSGETAVAKEVANFWLADGAANLRGATPYDVRTSVGAERLDTGVELDGKPVSYPPLAPEEGGASAKTPMTSGKVFFIGSDGLPHWCTGTAVRSNYRNLVATAGHCVLDTEAPDGPLGKWVFVPGYQDGVAPFGVFVGKVASVHHDFDSSRDYDRDVAFAVVHNGVAAPSPGELADTGRLGDSVGGQGLAFNQPLAPIADVFGYPAGPNPDGRWPYTGETLEWSDGPTFGVKVTGLPMDRAVGVASPFTGAGALGSSWLTQYTSGSRTGYLNGITVSAADTDGDGRYDTGVSPYFDAQVLQVFQYGANVWSGTILRPL